MGRNKSPFRVGFVLSCIILLFTVSASIVFGLLWPMAIGLMVVGFLLLLAFFSHSLYRPPENHIGVWYRLGRFHDWILPDRWVMILPWLDEIHPPVNLSYRLVEVEVNMTLTSDQTPFEARILVSFILDPVSIDPQFLIQALSLSDKDWEVLVRIAVHEVLPEVVSQLNMEETLTPTGRQKLRARLGVMLQRQLAPFGICIDPHRGVSIQRLLPDRVVLQALIEQKSATALGLATVERLLPLMKAAAANPDSARDTALLEWAATSNHQTGPGLILYMDEKQRSSR